MRSAATRAALLAAFAAALLAGCDREVLSATVVRGGEQRLAADERLRGALLLLGGDLAVPAGARVEGPVIVAAGALELAGEVGGDVLLAGGALRLPTGARIGGELRRVDGALERHPGAEIAGGIVDERGGRVPARAAAELVGLGGAAGGWLWSAGQALLTALLAALLARFAPRPLGRAAAAVQRHPLATGALGALAGTVGLALVVVMAFTLVLLPLVLLALPLAAVAVGFGWAALGALLARAALRREPGALAVAGATFGLLLALELLQFVPGGGLAALAAAALGIGGVLATRFGTRRFALAP